MLRAGIAPAIKHLDRTMRELIVPARTLDWSHPYSQEISELEITKTPTRQRKPHAARKLYDIQSRNPRPCPG